jgi:SAM-dependent methyltransferase
MSFERHRFVWLFFRENTNLFDESKKSMLHIAPEKAIMEKLVNAENLDYYTVDIENPLASFKMDITNLDFPDDKFDVIYCSHVLEHIEKDIIAMQELFRVLKIGGWAVIQVPIYGEFTIEDPFITSPEEREKLYGNPDHVRAYGEDILMKLENVGFNVEDINVSELVKADDRKRMGIYEQGKLFICTKTTKSHRAYSYQK